MKRLVVLVTINCCFGSSIALGITITKVADLDTRIPSGTGNFTRFEWPVLHDGIVHFVGRDSDSRRGIYRFKHGILEKVVDTTTSVPGASALFVDVRWPASDGKSLAFRGRSTLGGKGIYSVVDGKLAKIADSETQVPGGGDRFNSFGPPAIDNGQVVFKVETASGQEGIYAYKNHTIRTVADTNKTLDGGETFLRLFDSVRLDGDTILFSAASVSSQSGIYADRNGQVRSVVDDDAEGLSTVANFTADDGAVVFRSVNDEGQHGLYTTEIATNNGIRLIADAEMFSSDLADGFTFGRHVPLIDDNTFAFRAHTNDGASAIFMLHNDELTRIVKSGDLLDGKLVVGLDGFAGYELSGNQVAFIVTSSRNGDNHALYVATVPEPSHGLHFVVCLLALFRRLVSSLRQ